MQKQPVILQVLPSLRSGGVERGTVEIASAINKAGWKSMVASEGGAMVSQLAHAGATHITLPMAGKTPWAIWRNAMSLAYLIRKHHINIVHARSRAPAWAAFIAARSTGCRFMTTFHGTYGLQNKWKRRYNSIMARGERVVAISEFIANHIRENYTIREEQLRIIHRGVDLRIFSPFNHSAQRMISLSHEWRLPETLPLILFPARITRWKGQDVFLKALAQLPHRNFFAVLLGDDKGHETYHDELEKLIHDLDLAGHVRIARHTYHMTEAYMLAKLVVATSIEPEAFGRVVLEAQAMGKPVIATNHGGPQETVVPNETGLLVTPGNVEELSAAIAYVLGLSQDDHKWIGEQAIANAQRFSMDAMCSKTLSVYQELLNNK